MNAEKYLEEKARLSQALNGQENLDSAVTAITDVLKKYNLNLMPGTAFDVMCFTLETIQRGNCHYRCAEKVQPEPDAWNSL
nr:MAG TPA: hypothetical protein [Caudoviricetes sp.]